MSAFLLCGRPASALAASAHAEVELFPGSNAIRTGPFSVAVQFRIDPGWHIYWKNPGDSGLATSFEWDLPSGIRLAELLWPYPERIDDPSGTSYAYRTRATLIARFEVKRPAGPETTIRVKARWLACRDVCVPEEKEILLRLPVRDENVSSQNEALFLEALEAVPSSGAGWSIEARLAEGALALWLKPLRGQSVPKNVLFFPEDPELLRHDAPQSLRLAPEGAELELVLSGLNKKPRRIQGVLTASGSWDPPEERRAIRVDVPAGP